MNERSMAAASIARPKGPEQQKVTPDRVKLPECACDDTQVATSDLSVRPFGKDEITRGEGRDAFSGSLPRVLYAVVLDPAMKFGSLEEQICCLAQAFEKRGSLFYPLFICPEGASEKFFQEVGIAAECLDLRSFSWSRLVRLSRLISRRKITLVHWNFTDMLRNGYPWCD